MNAKALIAALSALAVSACGSAASVYVEYAPDIAGAERVHSLTVLDFAGPGGVEFAREVESVMVSARFRGAPAAAVVDPGAAGRRFVRGRYRPRGRAPGGLVEIARRVGVDGAIGGRVLDAHFDEDPYTREETRCVERDEEGVCLEYAEVEILCRVVRADIDARVVFVEAASAQTLFNDRLRGRSDMSYCEKETPPLSDDALAARAMRDAAEQLRELFLPYEDRVRAPFARPQDGLAETVRARFQTAYDLAGDGRFARACEIWDALDAEGARTPGLVYNRGLCAEISGDFELALERYDRAVSLAGGDYRDAERARRRVIVRMQERARLYGDPLN